MNKCLWCEKPVKNKVCNASFEHQFVKISGIRKIQKRKKTYNFSVEDDESYIAEDFVVHNCRSVLLFIQEDEK